MANKNTQYVLELLNARKSFLREEFFKKFPKLEIELDGYGEERHYFTSYAVGDIVTHPEYGQLKFLIFNQTEKELALPVHMRPARRYIIGFGGDDYDTDTLTYKGVIFNGNIAFDEGCGYGHLKNFVKNQIVELEKIESSIKMLLDLTPTK